MTFTRLVAGLASAAVVGVAALSASPLPAFGSTDIGNLKYAGERKGATRLKFEAGDAVQTQVDVATGNLMVSVRGLALVGAKTKLTTGAFYNSVAIDSIGTSTRLGRGWGLDYTPSINLKKNTDGSVTYTGSSGLTGVFDPASGNDYDSPDGFTVDLVKTSSGWTLTDHSSRAKEKFNAAGELVSREDRNQNLTTIVDTGAGAAFRNLSITAPAGPVSSRVATVSTDTAGKTTMSQASSSGTRTVSFTRTSGQMASFTDALARTTSFGYNSAGLLSTISAPGSRRTSFTYDSSKKVTSITQLEDASGGPGSSVTRLAYISDSETQVAGPNTDQTKTVTAVPHVTYSKINSDERVEKTEDEEGREQSDTYNPVGLTTQSTTGPTTSNEQSITKNTFGNGSESLTKSSTTGGQEMTMSYPTTSGPEAYQPTGGKDSGGVSTAFEYNGAGNPLSSTSGSNEKADLDYSTNPDDGTVIAAASPEDENNKTFYSYTNKQLRKITPKTGSTLGEQNLTYDDYGRTKTVSDGRGITATYAYDKLDRMTSTTFSDGMSVTYGYDTAGRQSTRTDPNGTTTYGYDQLSRMTTRKSTFGAAQTFNYKYDKAGWLTQTSSPTAGTVKYAYDNAGKVIDITYTNSTADPTPRRIHVKYDDHGRREEMWTNASTTGLTTWATHVKYAYNKDDKTTSIEAWEGTGDASNTKIIDVDYCYKPLYSSTTGLGVKAGADCTKDESPKLPQSSKLTWSEDHIGTNVITRYTYKNNGKLNVVYDVDSDGDSHEIYNYAYDKNGNRKEGHHLDVPVINLAFNSENQITTSGYTYDATGNMTARPAANGLPALSNMTYTAAEQPKSVTRGGTTYTYKHAGSDSNELLQQTSPGADCGSTTSCTYTFAYGRPAQSKVPTIETVSLSGVGTASVLNDPATGQPLMLRASNKGQATYIYDGTPGSPIALITSTGQKAFAAQYDPYGLQTVTDDSEGLETQQNPLTFAGGIQDRATEFVHYGQRYYDPATGTWTQRDTLDSPLSPNDANRYAYAGGDPINKTDPTGNIGFDPNQACLVSMAKDAKRGGVSEADGSTLWGWAQEYGLGGHGPFASSAHGGSAGYHVCIGPARHIPIN